MSETSGTHCADQYPSRRLLKGTCTLIFEGDSFVADGDDDRQYSLGIDEDIRSELFDRLRSSGWQYEFEAFHAEFWGSLIWTGEGFGHLGVFGGAVQIDEFVAIQFTRAKRVEPRFHSIAERLRSVRARSSS